MDDQKHLLQMQLFNLFGRNPDQAISWTVLLERMKKEYGADRDQVYEGMNELIDSDRIAVFKKDTYCLPAAVKNLEAMANQQPPKDILDRAAFDKMNPQEKMDFATKGGIIA